ncbi:protein of unknown function [Burkholderia multivorans]
MPIAAVHSLHRRPVCSRSRCGSLSVVPQIHGDQASAIAEERLCTNGRSPMLGLPHDSQEEDAGALPHDELVALQRCAEGAGLAGDLA